VASLEAVCEMEMSTWGTYEGPHLGKGVRRQSRGRGRGMAMWPGPLARWRVKSILFGLR
jgi:hypothetical protein